MTKALNKILVLCLMLCSVSANADGEISKHHQIMAGLLLHLTSFTQWQALESDNIELCLLGSDPFKEYIDEMVKRRPKNNTGKVIVVHRMANVERSELSQCQIIYIQPQHYEKLWQEVSSLQNVLLVSQSTNFIAQGGMVNFDIQNKRVKLEVNLPAVKAARLKISSKLLKHAKIISGKVHSNYTQEHAVNAQY